MRRFRNVLQASIPIVGALVIFLALILITDAHPQIRLGVVLLGILLIEAGVWGLTNPFLPSERKYLGLRRVVDEFILTVRALNQATLDARAADDSASWNEVRELLIEMHDAVDLMGELAGRTVEEEEILRSIPDDLTPQEAGPPVEEAEMLGATPEGSAPQEP